jgi:hypothetical protein
MWRNLRVVPTKRIGENMARKAMFVTRSPRPRAPEAVARSGEDEAAALGLPVLDA